MRAGSTGGLCPPDTLCDALRRAAPLPSRGIAVDGNDTVVGYRSRRPPEGVTVDGNAAGGRMQKFPSVSHVFQHVQIFPNMFRCSPPIDRCSPT